MCFGSHHRSSEESPRATIRAFDRGEFLKLAGSGLLGVALLGSVGAARVFAQAGPSPGASLTAEFAEAAQEYGVPMELLMAIGYVNTRWEMPSPETNAYRRGDPHGWGSYGIMALVRNPFSDTLGEASRLTGIPEEELKVDRAANIRGGAALLASSAGGYASGDPSDFYGAVRGFQDTLLRRDGLLAGGRTHARDGKPLWSLNRRWHGTRPTGPTTRRPTVELPR
jgi:hypothetical protein